MLILQVVFWRSSNVRLSSLLTISAPPGYTAFIRVADRILSRMANLVAITKRNLVYLLMLLEAGEEEKTKEYKERSYKRNWKRPSSKPIYCLFSSLDASPWLIPHLGLSHGRRIFLV